MTRSDTARRAAPASAALPAEAEPRLDGRIAAAIYFVLALLYFLPGFLPGRQLFGTDFTVSGYFYYDFLSQRFADGALPKWVPYVYGGVPLFSNPGSTYYPVRFVVDLLFPTSRMLAGIFVVQFWVAGVGAYLLARELGCRPWVAFVAGLAYQWTGITASWVYAGHDGRIIVATLSPLFLALLHRGIRTGRVAPFAGASAALGFALLSFQIQNAYYLLLAGAIWAVFCLVHLGVHRDRPRLLRTVALGIGAVVVAFVMGAVNFLPFRDYVAASPRGAEGGRGYEYSVSYSMPPGDLVAVAVPEQPGASVMDQETGQPLFPAYQGPNPAKLHSEYLGALVVLLLALGFAYARGVRYWQFFLGLTLFQLSLSFGGHTPLYRLYYAVLPGLNRFRAPDLAYFIAALSLVAMAALTLERMAELRASSAAHGRRVASGDEPGPFRHLPLVLGAVLAAVVLGTMAAAGEPVAPGTPTRAQGWGRFALFAVATGVVLWGWAGRRIGSLAAVVLLSVVTVGDLWVIGKRFLATVPGPTAIYAEDDVVQFLRAQPERGRVWVLPLGDSYRMPNYLMHFGIDMVEGEHGNQLQRWNELLGEGTQTYVDRHNVLREPRVVEGPAGQAVVFDTNPAILAAANVRYVVSMIPLAMPGWREVHRGSALVYENTTAMPRAYLVPEVRRVSGPEASLQAVEAPGWDPRASAVVVSEGDVGAGTGPLTGEARVTEYAPDRVAVRATASRPALLVLADNHYEGWEARVDGRPAPLLRANHSLRGVVVPAGTHEVVFEFHPRDLVTGLWLSLAAALLLALFGAWWLVRGRRAGEGAPAAAAPVPA